MCDNCVGSRGFSGWNEGVYRRHMLVFYILCSEFIVEMDRMKVEVEVDQ
jgi:hypothetical protein